MIDWNQELTPRLREWFSRRKPQLTVAVTWLFVFVPLIPLTFIVQDFSRIGWEGLAQGAQLARVGLWMPIVSFALGLGLLCHCLVLLGGRKYDNPKEASLFTMFAMMGTESAFKVTLKVTETQVNELSQSQSIGIQARFVLAMAVGMIWLWAWHKFSSTKECSQVEN